MAANDARGLYELGLQDLRENRKLGAEGFGLSFILPFAVTAHRFGDYSDRLDWLEFAALTREENKAVDLISLPLLKGHGSAGSLYEHRLDYHLQLYMLWTWQKRFAGFEAPGPKVRRGMFGRHISRERKPIPRKYLREEPRGFNRFSGGPKRHSHPTAIALDVVAMLVRYGLDEDGEAIAPPDGYENRADGD